jgi:hypothetical protein
VVCFYEFDTKRDHFEGLKHTMSNLASLDSNGLTVVAFSISCNVILHILDVMNAEKSNIYIKRVILLDPSNPFTNIHISKTNSHDVHPSFLPLSSSTMNPRRLHMINHIFDSKICKFIFNISKIFKPLLKIVTYLLGLCEKHTTPICVNKNLLQQDYNDLKLCIKRYMFSMTPFSLISKKCPYITHIFAGSKSQYYSYCQILSDQTPYVCLHTVLDVGHHFPHDPCPNFLSLLDSLI